MLDRLQSIHPRLQELARLDSQFRLFGASSHRYTLAPPLSEDEVRTFELLHGVRLPEDYRAFLLLVGRGGAGPYYGLNPLGHFEHAVGCLADYQDEPDEWRLGSCLMPDFLASPFPHRTAFEPVDVSFLDNLSEEEELSEEHEERMDAIEQEIWDDKWVLGTLCLSEHGCNIRDLLVVSGDERGHVWTDNRGVGGGLRPTEPNRMRHPLSTESSYAPMFVTATTERTTFLDWYEWWLDWCLQEVKRLGES